MNINQIMEELATTLEFSKNHIFTTINLDVVAIHEAEIRIKNLMNKYFNNFSMIQAISEKIHMGLEEAKGKGIISDYVLTLEGLKIIPANKESYESYPTKSHYILVQSPPNTSIA